jgi:hypothetical protein
MASPHALLKRRRSEESQRSTAPRRSRRMQVQPSPANGRPAAGAHRPWLSCLRVSQRPVFVLPRRLSIFVPSLHRESCAAHHHAPSSGACPNAVRLRDACSGTPDRAPAVLHVHPAASAALPCRHVSDPPPHLHAFLRPPPSCAIARVTCSHSQRPQIAHRLHDASGCH